MSEPIERRYHKRLHVRFSAELCTAGSDSRIEGVIRNLSQGGALIKTRGWHRLQLHEQAFVTVFIPPTFSGQNATFGLEGTAVVTRLDRTNQSVAVQFAKPFKNFQRSDQPDIS